MSLIGQEAANADSREGQLFLEDLLVREPFRGKKIGKGLLTAVARIGESEGYGGMCWEVLSWKHAGVEFYKSLEAEFLDDWRLILPNDDTLRPLGESAP